MSTSVLEMPSVLRYTVQEPPVQEHAVPEAGGLSGVVPRSNAVVRFTAEEIDSFHRDDAMTMGMIAVILGLAFTVLLGLVIGVNVWTAMVAT
jgi:hypothetical protein